MAAKASLASPSIDAPSDTVQNRYAITFGHFVSNAKPAPAAMQN